MRKPTAHLQPLVPRYRQSFLPLDMLRIPVGAVIINVNGQPTITSAQLLEQVEIHAKIKAAMMVEYVVKGQPQIMEFRFRK